MVDFKPNNPTPRAGNKPVLFEVFTRRIYIRRACACVLESECLEQPKA